MTPCCCMLRDNTSILLYLPRFQQPKQAIFAGYFTRVRLHSCCCLGRWQQLVLACLQFLIYTFTQVLGYDVLLDAGLQPWLVEVNHSPSFNIDSPLDRAIKQALIVDAVRLVRRVGAG